MNNESDARREVLRVIEEERKRNQMPRSAKDTTSSKKAETSKVRKAKKELEEMKKKEEQESNKRQKASMKAVSKQAVAPKKEEPQAPPPHPSVPRTEKRLSFPPPPPPQKEGPKPDHAMNAEKEPNEIRALLLVLLGIVGTIIIALGVFAVGIYRYKWENEATRFVSSIVPFPAAIVDNHFVTYSDYLENVDALRKNATKQKELFADAVQQFSDEEIRTLAIDKLIRDSVLRRAAKSRGLEVTQDKIDEAKAEAISSAGDERVFQQIVQEYYGWSDQEFTDFVLKPIIIEQMLQDSISGDATLDENALAQEKIQDVKTGLDNGEVFEDVAKDESEDISAVAGGDLGYVTLENFDPTFADAVRALDVGETSGIVQTPYGYHIIHLDDKVEPTDGDTTTTTYHVRHILIKTVTASDWMDAQVRGATVRKLILRSSTATENGVG